MGDGYVKMDALQKASLIEEFTGGTVGGYRSRYEEKNKQPITILNLFEIWKELTGTAIKQPTLDVQLSFIQALEELGYNQHVVANCINHSYKFKDDTRPINLPVNQRAFKIIESLIQKQMSPTDRDYYLVLRDTASLKRGMALPKIIITGGVYYGIDKKNNFYTERFLKQHPETFQYAGNKED